MLNSEEEILDSPRGWVARHIRRYVESNGERGHRWSGANTLLITTRGRNTGVLHRTALIYGRDRDRYIVVASNGGSKRHPNWYLNLSADSDVSVQVKAERFRARAATASGNERSKLWKKMVSIWPEYEEYQKRAPREIPVVILEPD
jgi:deazaflavin-dependent oxidoreductase (nitroreductase family)